MIAIPATAILLTNLDFWEKIRAVCCKLVPEQRTALAGCWYCFALILFAIILSWSNVCRSLHTNLGTTLLWDHDEEVKTSKVARLRYYVVT